MGGEEPVDTRPVRSPRSIFVVGAVVAVSTALLVAALVLHARTAALLDEAYPLYLGDVWVAVVMPPLGAWLWSRGAARTVAVVLLVQASLSVCGFAGELAAYDVALDGQLGDGGAAAAWLASFTWAPYLLLPTLLPLLYPTGRPPGRWGTAVGGLVVGALGLAAVAAALTPGEVVHRPGVTNPLGIAGDSLVAAGDAALGLIVLVGVPVCVLSCVLRAARRTGSATVHRVGVVAAASVLLYAAILTQDLLAYPWNDLWVAAAFSCLALAIVVSDHDAQMQRAWLADTERAAAVREEERRRVRADLHDGLGPELAGISLSLAGLSMDVRDDAVRAQLQGLRGDLSKAVGEVRRIVDGLRPAVLDELGLRGALSARAERLRAAGYLVDLDLDGARQLPHATEVAAYRIADEAVANAIHHAEASRLVLRCRHDADVFTMAVEDNGRGVVGRREGGVGMDSMRDRAREVGGALTIGVAAGGGTLVQLVVPAASTGLAP